MAIMKVRLRPDVVDWNAFDQFGESLQEKIPAAHWEARCGRLNGKSMVWDCQISCDESAVSAVKDFVNEHPPFSVVDVVPEK
jgi:hypothetical protein